MSSQLFCWGGAQKTTIREPVRLAHFQFSTAFVNGGHLQGKIRGKFQMIFDRKTLRFFSLAPSALAMSSQSLCWGGARKTTIHEPVLLVHFQFRMLL